MTSTATDLDELTTTFRAALEAGDSATALVAVEASLAEGADPIQLLTEVVAPAQRTVGLRWQNGEWSVAAEHAATAVAVAATEAVARHVRTTVPVEHGHVVVACAEREWHALPATMIECALLANGWKTTPLGASTSPLRLSQYLQDLGPDVLAVSCSMLGALPTTRRFIEAAASAGIPTVVGGPAFGPDEVRAKALGATAWAPDAATAVRVLAGLPPVVPPVDPLPAEATSEQAALELAHRQLLTDITAQWQPPEDLEIAEDAVQQTLHALWATLLTGDPRPLPDTARWITDLLVPRRADPGLVTTLATATTAVLRDYPRAHELLTTHWPAGPV
ncbi:cobalamin B12-binding domain protein [Kribbella flavida DSM 17836]|uniref:Cobalamin B12-binding domain protein n=1 Tax=Kribbella flavida (strain DSM 17836 / JCM 10339 / NBRC 14399) TaxID=479435 RepID=D2PWY6_KRIFD|nr:cobalamin-dependent protein [Kribbella flavida]ADB35366.1 cobalamin B12-binding domain protein [Kribbella flavida DSM 17836]